MTPEEIGARFVEALGGETVATASVSEGGAFARATVDVPAQRWVEAATVARDQLGCDFFDWLCGVDQEADGFAVVLHVWSTTQKFGLLLRTTVGRDEPVVDTITEVYPGASWPERETSEMFGIDFAGHPNLVPLLLSNEFEGHPLRKDFVLASRVVKAWPGAKEPGGEEGGGRARAPMRPPGVPDPAQWGPNAGK